MRPLSDAAKTVLRLSPRIEVLPILHGSGDVAQEVRETLIGRPFDCVAVPLPPSFESAVESAVSYLPHLSLVAVPDSDSDEPTVTFVPVDPCQPVIMGIRVAMGESIARAYIDREVERFEPTSFSAPDPYAIKHIPLAAFSAALIPSLTPPIEGSQRAARIAWMAFRLHELELEFESILCLCPVADWPWLRDAYHQRTSYILPESPARRPSIYSADPHTLYFLLGELPFTTALYEHRRAELRSDRHISVDGIKELLLETRTRWAARHERDDGSIPNWVTPQLLQRYLQYVRNLALMAHRLTPDLYTLVLAAKQIAGDDFAVTLLETAKTYGLHDDTAPRISTPRSPSALRNWNSPTGKWSGQRIGCKAPCFSGAPSRFDRNRCRSRAAAGPFNGIRLANAHGRQKTSASRVLRVTCATRRKPSSALILPASKSSPRPSKTASICAKVCVIGTPFPLRRRAKGSPIQRRRLGRPDRSSRRFMSKKFHRRGGKSKRLSSCSTHRLIQMRIHGVQRGMQNMKKNRRSVFTRVPFRTRWSDRGSASLAMGEPCFSFHRGRFKIFGTTRVWTSPRHLRSG